MSDIEKKPEQSVDSGEPTEKIEDLPTKAIPDKDAGAIKGGDLTLNYSPVKYTYTTQRP
jgi:hypothetical protein